MFDGCFVVARSASALDVLIVLVFVALRDLRSGSVEEEVEDDEKEEVVIVLVKEGGPIEIVQAATRFVQLGKFQYDVAPLQRIAATVDDLRC